MTALRWAAQALVYAVFAAALGYFSAGPAYVHHPPDRALVKLSFSHAGARETECRRLTPEEIADLPANMRRPLDCPRGRVSLLVELELDGTLLYRAELPPSGVAGDGASTVYQRFPVAAGRHRLVARLRDSRRSEGFDYERSETVELRPRQNFVVDFRADTGGFVFL